MIIWIKYDLMMILLNDDIVNILFFYFRECRLKWIWVLIDVIWDFSVKRIVCCLVFLIWVLIYCFLFVLKLWIIGIYFW